MENRLSSYKIDLYLKEAWKTTVLEIFIKLRNKFQNYFRIHKILL